MKVLSTSLFALLACACASEQTAHKPATTAQADPARAPAAHRQHAAAATARAQLVEPAHTSAAPARHRNDDATRDSTLQTTSADNTRNNARDRDNPVAATPLDQGNHTADLEIARKIRKAVTSDDSLSFAAKNVKIIAEEGEVTLRGSVNTPAEKHTIDTYSRQVVGAAHVHDELSVDH